MSLDVIDHHLEKQSSTVKIRQSWQHPDDEKMPKAESNSKKTQNKPEDLIQETNHQ